MPIMNMKYLFISICLLLPVSIHAQEFIRADNIYDLAFIAQNGDSVRYTYKPKKFIAGTRYYYRHKRKMDAIAFDKMRRNALSDTLADRMLLSDTLYVMYHLSYPIVWGYSETWSFNGEYYGYSGPYNGEVTGTWSEDENMMRILEGRIVYTDSIQWGFNIPQIYDMDKFIRILPGLYEHTTYKYAIGFSDIIYYGPMDNLMDE